MCIRSPGGLVEQITYPIARVSDSVVPWGSEMCSSKRFPGYANGAGLETTTEKYSYMVEFNQLAFLVCY